MTVKINYFDLYRVRFHSIVMEAETSELFVFNKFACQVCGLNSYCSIKHVFFLMLMWIRSRCGCGGSIRNNCDGSFGW